MAVFCLNSCMINVQDVRTEIPDVHKKTNYCVLLASTAQLKEAIMKFIGNLIWFLVAGLIMWISWALAGILWCITIIGIPWGVQCFKFAKLCLFPFGKEVRYGGGAGSLILNILWIVISGVPLAIEAAIVGVVFCITIIGIPFGKQCFKIAKLALMPFGTEIIG